MTPVASGQQAADQGWRWCYWTLAIVDAVLFFALLFGYEETKYAAITIRGVGGSTSDLAQEEVETNNSLKSDIKKSMQGTDLVTKTSSVVTSQPNIPMLSYRQRLRFITKTDEKYLDLYVRPMRVLLTFPAVTYTAIQYGFCLCWISAIASITAIILPYPPYNFGTTAMGLTNLAPFIGSLLGTGLNGILGDWLIGWLARRNQGFYEPETRLYLLPLPVLTISGGLVMTGITAYNVCQSQIRKVQPLIILPNS